MGSACSPQDERDRGVEEEIDRDRMAYMRVHKLLLLGSGNSGKSTFMKQLTSIHGGGTAIERKSKTQQIQDSIVQQMLNVIQAFEQQSGDGSTESLGPELKEHVDAVKGVHSESRLTTDLARAIKALWGDAKIKSIYQFRTSLTIVDSCAYFFNNIERIAAPGYEPTEKDYLLTRIKTTGVIKTEFEINGNQFAIHDVGGQRSERSKWINCFDTVDAVLYVASLSCYDQMLHEDDSKNAMIESLELFSETINNRYFRHTGFILFLNKSDLFAEKIVRDDVVDVDDPDFPPNQLRSWFDDYEGADYSYDDGITFILETYKKMSTYSEEEKPIFHHVTCATARDNVQKVFDDVQNQVVMRSLKKNGLL